MTAGYLHVIGQRSSLATLQRDGHSPQAIKALRFLRWRVDTGDLKAPEPLVAIRGIADDDLSARDLSWLAFLVWRIAGGEFSEGMERN